LSVAILIVNYRVYDELTRALSSLAPFVRPEDEVVVFDQESDAAKLAKVAAAQPRVRMIPHPANRGFAAGINQAARTTTVPYLLWLNPDCVVGGPVVEQLEQWLSTHPEVAVVGPRVMNEDGTVQASARRFPGLSTAFGGRTTWLTRHFPQNALSRHNLPAREATEPMVVDWVAGSCFMTRRSVFEALGGLDEDFFLYWEDADFCRRAKDAGLGSSMYIPRVQVRHSGGRSAALTRSTSIRAFHRSAYRLYRKHAGPLRKLASPLVGLMLRLRAEVLVRGRDI
jgi:N-acetylglucosaminyl-diphospho-decaprenol L-rhamnosyltransferase